MITINKNSDQRDLSLDLVRIFAFFSVVSVHFFLNTGFYEHIIKGEKMYIMTTMRTFFMVCVPLFLMLTGYLMNKKQLSKKYYKGITKTIGIYILASIACIIFKNIFSDYGYTLKSSILSILNFSGANYSWYVEMYIGLFLMIPFLNIIWNSLSTKKEHKILLYTFLLLSSVPGIVNILNINVVEVDKYDELIPNWWTFVYPITYYFLGSYISKYKSNITKLKNFLLIIIVTIIFGTFNYFSSYHHKFISTTYNDWGSLMNIIPTYLVFIFILKTNVNNWKPKIKRLLPKISNLCLGAYLLSFIFDQIFYKILNTNIPKVTDKLIYFPLIVITIIICSLILSYLINILYNIIYKLILFLHKNIKKSHRIN